ncbi:MAG TPA: hypothetical protein VFA07_11825 [Chthonomonadaceae bacterium]|nr:hypothetical protein [Chthonomonadaceae bacterium]
MRRTLRKVRRQVEAITSAVEQYSGLRSRWNGQIAISEEVDLLIQPVFLAKKEWDCSILIHQYALRRKDLIGTLIHECMHAASMGLTPSAYLRFRGYEEGVVEQMTRLLTPRLAGSLNIPIQATARISYQDYIAFLETIRAETGKAAEDFYLNLLRTPLADREDTVVQWAIEANRQEPAVRMLVRIASAMRGLK